MTLARRSIFAFLVALTAGVIAPAAHADAPLAEDAAHGDGSLGVDAAARARTRYDEGTRAFREGRFVEAALEFESAAAEKANAVALYTAALSWERANAPDRAADDYARSLDLGKLPPDSAATAAARLKSLETLLGSLRVTTPEPWRVQLDANTETLTPATLHGATGVHTLTVRPPAAEIMHVTVVIRSGTVTSLRLPSGDSQKVVEEGPPPAGLGAQRAWAIAATGVGVAGIGVWTAFGIMALSKKSQAQNLCAGACDKSEGSSAWHDATVDGNIATAGLIAAGAGLAGAAVLWLTAPNASEPSGGVGVGSARVDLGLGSVRIRASW